MALIISAVGSVSTSFQFLIYLLFREPDIIMIFLGNSEEIKKLLSTETELKTKIGQLEQNLSESELAQDAAQKQFEQVQKKLEDFSTIHEENSNLKVDKLQLENEVSKLRYDNMACQVLKKCKKSDFQSILCQKLNKSSYFIFHFCF